MRQIFSVRFFAAVGCVAALLFVLVTVFAARRAIDGDDLDDGRPAPRSIDLVDHIVSSSSIYGGT